MGAEFETNIHCVRQLMFASSFPLTTTTTIIASTHSDLQKSSYTVPLPSPERCGPVQFDSVSAKKFSREAQKGGTQEVGGQVHHETGYDCGCALYAACLIFPYNAADHPWIEHQCGKPHEDQMPPTMAHQGKNPAHWWIRLPTITMLAQQQGCLSKITPSPLLGADAINNHTSPVKMWQHMQWWYPAVSWVQTPKTTTPAEE
jgi:hypothetical protein